jgi:hypothetical protein
MLNISPDLLKRAFLSIALTSAMCMGTAVAQEASTDPMVKPDAAETTTMDNYLNNHPKVAKELHENPSLINNPQWLAQHPNVNSYMAHHPALKTDAASRPNEFVNHTERQDLERDHKGLNNMDALAREHPKVADELKNNPRLIDDPKYLASHPGLDNYLAKHPEIRQEAQAHPEAFAKAAEANHNYDKNHYPAKPAPAKPATTRPASAAKRK